MKKDFMDDRFLIKDVMDTTVENIERAFAEPAIMEELKGSVGGKELLYNMIFIRSIGGAINFYESLYKIDPDLIAKLPTDEFLDSFRIIIDGIEETFKAKDKELEAAK